jgi:hypothetical protein
VLILSAHSPHTFLVESVAGFILLCLYWIGNDANVMKHYGAIAGMKTVFLIVHF